MFAKTITNWKHLYYSQEAIVPDISFKDGNIKDLGKIKFQKFDISRSYRYGKKTPNVVIKDSILYTIDSSNKILEFSLERKKLLAKHDLPISHKESTSGIAINGEDLFITFENGEIFSFSLTSKTINWHLNVTTPINSAPVISDNKVFIVSNNTVYAISITSGTLLWSYIGSKSGVSLRSIFSPTLYSGYLFLGLSSSDIVVLRQEQGSLFWKTNISSTTSFSSLLNPLMGDIKSPIIPINDKIIVAANNKIALYNAFDKEEIWKNTKVGSYGVPIYENGKIFLVDTNSNILSLNFKKGDIFWQNPIKSKKKTSKRTFWYGPISFNGMLLVVNSLGELMFLSKDNGSLLSHKILFSFKKEKLYSPPVVTSEYIAILSSYGNLYINKK